MTKFLDDHPGGSEIMVDCAGRDATEDFEDVVHSSTARKQLEGLVIGDLHEDDVAKLREAGGVTKASSAAAVTGAQKHQSPMVTLIKAILPFVLIALAFLYNKYKVGSPA